MYIRTGPSPVRLRATQGAGCGVHASRICTCVSPAGLSGYLGRAAREEVLTTVAEAMTLTDLATEVSENLRHMTSSLTLAAKHVKDRYRIDRSHVIPSIGLIATKKGYQEYTHHAVNALLRRADAELNKKRVSIDEIERQVLGHYIVPIPRGTGVWACVNSRKGSKVIVGLGAPSRGVMSGLHEAMHALSNPQGVPRILMLSEGGAEFYARQAARARGITYQKTYDDQEAIFGKLVTDLGDQPVADAFFHNPLSKFEEAFTKTYGAGRLQQLIDLPSSALLSASKLVNLDYETMTNGRP